MKIVKHANEYWKVNDVVKYKGEFPSLTESVIRGGLKRIIPSSEQTCRIH